MTKKQNLYFLFSDSCGVTPFISKLHQSWNDFRIGAGYLFDQPLRKQHLWGDLSDEEYRREGESLERKLKLVAQPAQPSHLPNLERAAKLLEDMPALWRHPGVTDEQREALVREVFRRITIDGKQFVSIEPQLAYVPIFAALLTGQKVGYRVLDSTPAPDTPILLPSGIIVSRVDEWVTKLADVA